MSTKIGFEFNGSPCNLRVRATGEIVEVCYCQTVDRRGNITGRFVETGTKREFEKEDLFEAPADEVRFALEHPDTYNMR